MLSVLHLSFLSFAALLAMLLYRYRSTLPSSLRSFSFLSSSSRSTSSSSSAAYAPLSTFADQAAAGMSSSAFDIEADNLRQGDARLGLDDRGAREVADIMRSEGVNFDQARLIRHNRYLAANGIDPSGMPLDSKAITHL